MAAHRDVKELVEIGAYVAGAATPTPTPRSPGCRRSTTFLRQAMDGLHRRCAATWAATPRAGAHDARPPTARPPACARSPASATVARARQPARPPAGHRRARRARGRTWPSSATGSTRRCGSTAVRRRVPRRARRLPALADEIARPRPPRLRGRPHHHRVRPGPLAGATRRGCRPSSCCSSGARDARRAERRRARGPRARRHRRPALARASTEVTRHERHRRHRHASADPVPAGDARSRSRAPGRPAQPPSQRAVPDRVRHGGRPGRRRRGRDRRGRGRRGQEVHRPALRLGRHRPREGRRTAPASSSRLQDLGYRPAPRLRRPGARRPAGREHGPGAARRPDRVGQLQPQQRRRPHRDLRRQRQDDRGAAHRPRRPPRRRPVDARRDPPDPPRRRGGRRRDVRSPRVSGGHAVRRPVQRGLREVRRRRQPARRPSPSRSPATTRRRSAPPVRRG